MRIVMGIFGGSKAFNAKLKEKGLDGITDGDIFKYSIDKCQTPLLAGAGLVGAGAYGLHRSRKVADPKKKKLIKRLSALGLGAGAAGLAAGGAGVTVVHGLNNVNRTIGRRLDYYSRKKENGG